MKPVALIVPFMFWAYFLSAAETSPHSSGGERSLPEGLRLPWCSSGVWPYSPCAGEAPSPEAIIQSAVVLEAEQHFYAAFYEYRRLLVEYPILKNRSILAQACFGMARSLAALNRPADAARILVEHCSRGGVLRGDERARSLLDVLRPALASDAEILRAAEALLRSWPEPETPAAHPASAPDAQMVLVPDDRIPPPSKGAEPKVLFERVKFYLKYGSPDAARVYADFIAARFPGSPYADNAQALVERRARRRR
ncbi:MAG TPA: hypothetical protein ENN09_05930 [Planctomycetes bacterium]|nr:hypothetical protein [Planctomycetota bacterium]